MASARSFLCCMASWEVRRRNDFGRRRISYLEYSSSSASTALFIRIRMSRISSSVVDMVGDVGATRGSIACTSGR